MQRFFYGRNKRLQKTVQLTARNVQSTLRQLADPIIAKRSKCFFKMGKGDYAEGDQFLGIRVPVLRAQVKILRDLVLDESIKILASRYHEERLFALLHLVQQFSSANLTGKKAIYMAYMNNRRYINNWDLVDSSAHHIVGAYLLKKDRAILYCLATSSNLWDRRIAILTCFCFIKAGDYDDILRLSEILLDDSEDLIHKAVGWMLRELGKRNAVLQLQFLDNYYQRMPRVMLRYAIEHLSDNRRRDYLQRTP